MSLGMLKMRYEEVVKRAKEARKNPYGYGKVEFCPCDIWQKGDQINLWTYWQGYQLKDIDEKGVDILLVGQDWGNPKANEDVCKRIEEIIAGRETVFYDATASETDRNLTEMFHAFGENIDITKKNPGMRLFFTNYSLGYRKGIQTGSMTKTLMRMDDVFFKELVTAIKPKIIICLGQCTYEVVTNQVTKGFSKQLSEGIPFMAPYPHDAKIPVYGVAHCGSRGRQNVGGRENMRKAWDKIAKDYIAAVHFFS